MARVVAPEVAVVAEVLVVLALVPELRRGDAVGQGTVVEHRAAGAAAVPRDELRHQPLDAVVEALDQLLLGRLAEREHLDAVALAQHAGDDQHAVQVRAEEVAAGLDAALLVGDLGVGQVLGQAVQPPDAGDVGHRLDVERQDRGHQSGNTPVVRYRSPRSHTIVTMTAFFSSLEMRRATCMAPPDEMPAKMPSSRAMRRVISSASPWLTDSMRSTRLRS